MAGRDGDIRMKQVLDAFSSGILEHNLVTKPSLRLSPFRTRLYC